MKLVLLESPFAGNVVLNQNYAREAMADCFMRGEAPFASHLLYTQPNVLNDLIPAERALGIEAGLQWGKHADYSVVYTDVGMSRGMTMGVERARREGREVVFRSLCAVRMMRVVRETFGAEMDAKTWMDPFFMRFTSLPNEIILRVKQLLDESFDESKAICCDGNCRRSKSW